jgi:hypothetical protein
MRPAVLFAALAVALSAGCSRPGCYEEKTGENYTCTCPRRCNFQDSTYTTTVPCAASNSAAVTSALGNCGGSCTPSATCASCSCTTTGESCYQEKCPK